jgi:hypothetical protein
MFSASSSATGYASVNSVFLASLTIFLGCHYAFNTSILIIDFVHTGFTEEISSTSGASKTSSCFKWLPAERTIMHKNIGGHYAL